jgi:hypothetical protein
MINDIIKFWYSLVFIILKITLTLFIRVLYIYEIYDYFFYIKFISKYWKITEFILFVLNYNTFVAYSIFYYRSFFIFSDTYHQINNNQRNKTSYLFQNRVINND